MTLTFPPRGAVPGIPKLPMKTTTDKGHRFPPSGRRDYVAPNEPAEETTGRTHTPEMVGVIAMLGSIGILVATSIDPMITMGMLAAFLVVCVCVGLVAGWIEGGVL